MAIAEYTFLTGFALAGLIWVLGRHPGTVPFTRGWFSLNRFNGKGDLAAGLVASVYIFSGQDGTFNVSEEIRHRRMRADRDPGRGSRGRTGDLSPRRPGPVPGELPRSSGKVKIARGKGNPEGN